MLFYIRNYKTIKSQESSWWSNSVKPIEKTIYKFRIQVEKDNIFSLMALDCDEFDMIRIQIGNFITNSKIYRV